MIRAKDKEIPEEINMIVWAKLPEGYRETIRMFAQKTAYGEVFYKMGLECNYDEFQG